MGGIRERDGESWSANCLGVGLLNEYLRIASWGRCFGLGTAMALKQVEIIKCSPYSFGLRTTSELSELLKQKGPETSREER
jgi:hypothetical protein